MKLNNKGFAISTIMYIILIMAVVIITLTLSLLSNRKLILDKIKSEVIGNLYNEESGGSGESGGETGGDISDGETTKACSGTGTSVGDVITCGEESFYVMSSTNDTVTMLSKYNINVSTSNPVQSSSAGTTYFAGAYIQSVDAINSGYLDASDWCYSEDWEDTSNTCLAYWTWNSGYVYNENSHLYQYINAYKSTLKGKGVTVLSAKVMSKSQYNTLISGSCSSGCDWLYSTNYWLGDTVRSRTDQDHPEHLHINVVTGGMFSSAYCALGYYGIRPVVTISKDEINFN